MQLGEERQRGGEPEPTVEVVPVRAIAQAETDERDEAEKSLEGKGEGEEQRLVLAGPELGHRERPE